MCHLIIEFNLSLPVLLADLLIWRKDSKFFIDFVKIVVLEYDRYLDDK